jgi:hypothetical protein
LYVTTAPLAQARWDMMPPIDPEADSECSGPITLATAQPALIVTVENVNVQAHPASDIAELKSYPK